jgi:tetraacyldisaccharide 4'-kinase
MRAPEFWDRDGRLARALAPTGWAFAFAGRLRRALARPWRAPVRVLCVGNAVAGGAGKTPVVIDLARRLTARGRAVHILGTGYSGRERGPLRVDPKIHDARAVGDEALLLARACPTWIARDRRAGIAAAAAAGASVVLLDDGHQDSRIVKDASLPVIDADYWLGNGRVVPAGPLREPWRRALARASAIALIGEATPGVAEWGGPVLRGRLEPAIDLFDVAARPVLAFAGIGRPAKFFAMLDRLGLRVVERHAFPDHHVFDEDTVMRLVEAAAAKGATPVTTEKDFVRLREEARFMITPIPVAVVWADEALVESWLDGVLPR